MADFYAALRRQNGAAPLADFATALNTATSASVRDLPPLLPTITAASANGAVGITVLINAQIDVAQVKAARAAADPVESDGIHESARF